MFALIQKMPMKWGGAKSDAQMRASAVSAASFYYVDSPEKSTEEEVRDPIALWSMRERNFAIHRYDTTVPPLRSAAESFLGQLEFVFARSKFAAKSDFTLASDSCMAFAHDASMIYSLRSRAERYACWESIKTLPQAPSALRRRAIEYLLDIVSKQSSEGFLEADYVYALSIVRPINIIRKVDSEKLSTLVPKRWLFSCMRGQLPHELIYSISKTDLRKVLEEVLSHCHEVEISSYSKGSTEILRQRFSF